MDGHLAPGQVLMTYWHGTGKFASSSSFEKTLNVLFKNLLRLNIAPHPFTPKKFKNLLRLNITPTLLHLKTAPHQFYRNRENQKNIFFRFGFLHLFLSFFFQINCSKLGKNISHKKNLINSMSLNWVIAFIVLE
jgi:hypothetical protein